MFKRRHHPHWVSRLREWVWPRSGWHRVGRYLIHRLARVEGCPEYIACGMAFGVAVSFTPFIGLHFLLAAALAWIFGGSVIASAFGTIIGNPWTFPFIWLIIYRIGATFLGSPDLALEEMDWNFLKANFSDVLWPMMVGAIPLCTGSWCVTYFVVRHLIAAYQRRRRAAIGRGRLRSSSRGS